MGATSLDLLQDGWLLSQSGTWTTAEFVRHAKKRGFNIRWEDLAALYKQRLLVPLLVVHDDRVGSPAAVGEAPSESFSLMNVEVREAALEGRVADPFVSPLPDEWRFDARGRDDPKRWWNGLVYSPWQLLGLAPLVRCFDMMGWPRQRGDVQWLADVDDAQAVSSRNRDLGLLLSAIDARYLPVTRSGWLHIRGARSREWAAYRAGFDAAAVADQLRVDGSHVVRLAERLLISARDLDPTGAWYRLIRQANARNRDKLHGLARLAVDLRLAAEMLLLFADDLGNPAPPPSGAVWHPLRDRIGHHGEHLDNVLQDFGISPHVRVALVLEGPTELILARHILEHLGYGKHPPGLEIIIMRGVPNREPVRKLASHLATPIVTDALPDSYLTLRPVCRVIVATDPEKPMDNPAAFKQSLIGDIRQGLHEQGIDDVAEESLDWLVETQVWSAPLEFELFDDNEIAQAMQHLPHRHLPTGRDAVEHVADARAAGRSLKKGMQPLSKTALAEALWPVLLAKIDASLAEGSPLPDFAEVVDHAARFAGEAMDRRWVLDRTQAD